MTNTDPRPHLHCHRFCYLVTEDNGSTTPVHYPACVENGGDSLSDGGVRISLPVGAV